MMDIDKVLTDLPRGPYRLDSLRFMVKLVSMTKELKGDYLEVGSLAGRSSVVIGMEAKKRGDLLYCVDVWDFGEWKVIANEIGSNASKYPERPEGIFSTFEDTIRRFNLQDTVSPIVDRSENVLRRWDKIIADKTEKILKFIHIDGCHEYDFVKKDIGWREYLVKGGIICFHDYTNSWPGVKKAVNESFNSNSQFKRVGLVGSLLAFKRVT